MSGTSNFFGTSYFETALIGTNNWILETYRKKLDIRINYFSQILGDQYNKEDLCRLDAPYCLLVLGGLTLGLSVGGKYFILSSFFIFIYIFFRKKSSYNWQKNFLKYRLVVSELVARSGEQIDLLYSNNKIRKTQNEHLNISF